MSEPNTGSTPDRVRAALARTADELTLDATTPAAVMERGTRRRRRRRAALAGGVAVVAMVAVGTVVGTRDRGDDTIELSTPETTSPATTEPTAAPPTSATPPTPPPTTVPITTPATLPPVSSAEVTPALPVGPGPNTEVAQLLPWRDGFLSIGITYTPQPLTPLSDEMSALFPDEVVALFPDGLPPTIQEATDILGEAGLLDEVSDVLAAHPEVSDAIYATPPPPPTFTAAYTVDGIEWTTTELALTTTYPGQFVVGGDRLVTWSAEPVEPVDPVGGPPEIGSLVISASTDLETWESTTIELDTVDDLTNRPDHLREETFVNSLAVVGDRWIAQVGRHIWVDYESLLPDELRVELATGDGGYGISDSDEGISIITHQPDGTQGTTYEFTWAELGLDGSPQLGIDAELDRSTMLVGTFGGDHDEMPSPVGRAFATIAGAGEHFVLLGETVQVSPDGRTWTPLEGLPADANWHAATVVSGGVLLVGDGPVGPFAWLWADDGTLAEVQLPELPGAYGLWNQSGTAAWITEVGEPPQPEWDPLEVVVEHDGFVLTMLDGPDGTSFTLTDASSGTVVWAMNTRPEASGDDIWEYDEATDEATMVITDEDGAEIVRIPGEVIDAGLQAALEAAGPPNTAVPDEFDLWLPDVWLIATADGVAWLTVDLPDPDPEVGYRAHVAAINGGAVLYLTGDGWVLEALPS